MRTLSGIRAALIAASVITFAGAATVAHAASGGVRLNVVKAGWILGASGGSGTLSFQGRRYPLSVGGISAGLVFGASGTDFTGTVSNIRRPSDIAGVYGAVGAGATLGAGARVITLRNEKGAVLQLSGRQVGLMANLDLSGMTISIR